MRVSSTQQVAEASGLSYRTIDLYTRRGIITPEVPARGSGSARLWTRGVIDDLAALRARIEACPFHPHGGQYDR